MIHLYCSSRDRDHGGPDGMEPDGVIEVSAQSNTCIAQLETGLVCSV